MVRVSAIIPVYNQEGYLASAIESVLGQTYRDFELIVVDDGSTDGTPSVIQSFGDRIRAFRKPNGGNASALNLGIRQARGEWIGWLSSDDLWEPTKLERQLDAVKDASRVGLVYTDVLHIDADGRVLGPVSSAAPADPRRRLLALVRTCFVNGSSTLVRREVFDAVGLFDEGDRIASDFDLWLRIAQRYDFLHIPEPLVRYRIHPGQISKRRDAQERAGKRVASRAVRRMGPFWGAIGWSLRVKDSLALLPWQVRASGGGYSLANRIRSLLDTGRILVNPGTV